MLAENYFLIRFYFPCKMAGCMQIEKTNQLSINDLEDLEPGRIMLQAQQAGHWIEYKQVRVKPL